MSRRQRRRRLVDVGAAAEADQPRSQTQQNMHRRVGKLHGLIMTDELFQAEKEEEEQEEEEEEEEEKAGSDADMFARAPSKITSSLFFRRLFS